MTLASDSYPRRLGRYTLVAPLGEGGMASVHVARRDGDPRVCVLKQLHVAYEHHTETRRRFQREAHIASLLDHPNIARVVDAGMEGDIFCLALEMVAGRTVEQVAAAARRLGGTLPFEVSLRVVMETLDGLAHAHARCGPDGRPLGLVHRDAGPRNVMLGFDGSVKIIDFGIAKGAVDDHRTAAGVLMGTPFYMSPEQARAESVDARSDLYTVAVVLYELLVGCRLVQKKGQASILRSVVHEPAPSLLTVNRHAPPALEPVLARALDKAPEARFQTAQDFREALANAIQRTPSLRPLDAEGQAAFLRALDPGGEAAARSLLGLVRELAPMRSDATRVAAQADLGHLERPEVLPTRLEDGLGPMVEPTRLASDDGYDPTRAMDGPLPEPTMLGLAPQREAALLEAEVLPTQTASGFAVPRRSWRPVWLGASALAACGLGGLVWLASEQAQIAPVEPPPRRAAPTLAASAAPRPAPSAAPRAAQAPLEPAKPAPSEAARTRRERPSRTRPRPEPPPPAEAAAPNLRQQLLTPLSRRLAALRQIPDRGEAVALADAFGALAARALPPRARAEVEAEAERVLRSTSVEGMIEALGAAERAARAGLR